MPRLVSTLLVLGLLVGTAVAFAVTERLKLVPSPIVAPKVTEAISPGCRCPTAGATVSFRLREPDRVTLEIVNARGDAVDRLVDGESRPGGPFSVRWDSPAGALPDGRYRARVHLARARRTIVIPNAIRIDTKPPQLTVESVRPRIFSPDGDGNADKVSVRFTVDEESRVSLLADGDVAVTTPPRAAGKIDWYAKRERPGRYALRAVAHDLAGNASARSAPVAVRLRFVELAPRRVVVPVGVRFGVRVSSDAERYRWRLGARRGASARPVLVLRAPQRSGRYTLRVSYGRYAAAIPVFVRPR